MQIDITEFFNGVDTWPLSGSVATHGPNAGPNTWNNAKAEAAENPLLKTDAELDAMRQWASDTGAWEKDEIAAWTPDEVNALFIQLVAGDMREGGLDESPDDEAWAEYQAGAEAGRYSGNIYRGDIPDSPGFGRVFYYLGS